MKVLGAHVRTPGGRYAVGFALVDDDDLARDHTYDAPADRDEAGQLADLFGIATDLVTELEPDLLTIRANESLQSSVQRLAHHAEGVIMAAAGGAGVKVERLVTQSIWKPAGLVRGAKSAESVAALCAQLRNPPNGPPELDQAAAAARAGIVRAT